MAKKYIDTNKIQWHSKWLISDDKRVFAYKDEIDNIPAADVEEVKHGEWEEVKHREDALVLHSYLKCSCCGTEFHASLMAGCCADIEGDGYVFPNCPACRAVMDGKESEE